MSNYRAYFLDLDGTVYRGNTAIKEAVEFIHHLQNKGIEPFFVTNNASMTLEQIRSKLAQMDVQTTEEHIITSAIVAAHYIAEHFPAKEVFMIGETGLREALLDKQIPITENLGEVVVMGIDRSINYEKLSIACLSIRNGAAFISTNSDHAFPTERGYVPGNGAFTKLVEHSTEKEALFMGKPQPFILEMIQQRYGFAKEEMVMIGDNYHTDILTGIHFGIDTAHVNSGVHRTEEVRMMEKQPTYFLESLKDWIK